MSRLFIVMQNARLDDSQAEIKIAGKNINNFRYADGTTLIAESKEQLKSFLMRAKEESEKAGLKLNIQKTKIMASTPFTSWQINWETMEIVTDLIFLGSKITVNGDFSHVIKMLVPLKESYDKPRQLCWHHFADKGLYSQSCGFPINYVQMWDLDHKDVWAQNWCFQTVVLEKTLESPLNFKDIKLVNPRGN